MSAIALLLAFSAAWADSPLTSTHFSNAYTDHPMVQMARETLQGKTGTLLVKE